MKERPILFSAPMVRALLDGSKTQTRRSAKHPLLQTLSYVINIGDGWFGDEEGDVQVKCPYGQPGDQIWVRETWLQPGFEPVIYKADEWAERLVDDCKKNLSGPQLKWKPSIHMPRAASRIQLEITGVRVERLQDISEEDAFAEGVQDWLGKETPWKDHLAPVAVHAYAALWEAINGPGSWAANPWVWVVEFRRVKP